MDTKWIKIRAWHAVSKAYEGTVIDNPWAVTYCGRPAYGRPVDDLPSEKSCESCLRIVARLNDQ